MLLLRLLRLLLLRLLLLLLRLLLLLLLLPLLLDWGVNSSAGRGDKLSPLERRRSRGA